MSLVAFKNLNNIDRKTHSKEKKKTHTQKVQCTGKKIAGFPANEFLWQPGCMMTTEEHNVDEYKAAVPINTSH